MSFNLILRQTADFATKSINFSFSYFPLFLTRKITSSDTIQEDFIIFISGWKKPWIQEARMTSFHFWLYVLIQCSIYTFKSCPCVVTKFISELEKGFQKQCHNINDHWWRIEGLIRKNTVVFISLIKGR